MELLAAVVGAIVMKPCCYVFGSTKSTIKNFRERKSNFRTLKNDMGWLKEFMNGVKAQSLEWQNQLKDFERVQVEDWLKEVDDLEAEAAGLELSGSLVCPCCGLVNTCCGLPSLCKKSRKLVRCIEKAKKLKESSDTVEKLVNFRHRERPVEDIPGPSITAQDTAAKNLAQLSDLLKNDDVTRIGVCGMGGVGKTTLLKNLNDRLALERTFSIAIWVTVSKDASLRRIQARIFERMKVEVNMEQSEESLASQLHEKLKNKRSFLLILDDVWEALDLDAVGIPRPERCPGSKTIITSRSFLVCRQMNMQSFFEVKVLNEEEAWELFYEKAGDVVLKEDIRPVAEMVAKECGGLPLSITVVGASMRGKSSIALWDDALRALRNSEPLGICVEDKVFKSIKWSYDSLESKNHKLCLLFCCLYPEDFYITKDELVGY